MTDSPSSGAASKGKKRDTQRVSFAPSIDTSGRHPHGPSEREPLLTKSPTTIGAQEDEDDEDEDEAEEAQDTVGSLPSRLYRKTKKGLMVGGGKIRRAGAFPMYRGNADDAHEGEITTQRALLYCVLALVAVAALLGAVVLVQGDGGVCPVHDLLRDCHCSARLATAQMVNFQQDRIRGHQSRRLPT